MHRDALGCTVMHWDARGCTGMHWDALGCTGMDWVMSPLELMGGPKSLGLGGRCQYVMDCDESTWEDMGGPKSLGLAGRCQDVLDCVVRSFSCFCLFGSNACRTRVEHRRNRHEFWHTVDCFGCVAQAFITRMSELLVPQQLFCLFLCAHGIDGDGVLFKHGLDWASKDLRHFAALFVEVFGGCADAVIS